FVLLCDALDLFRDIRRTEHERFAGGAGQRGLDFEHSAGLVENDGKPVRPALRTAQVKNSVRWRDQIAVVVDQYTVAVAVGRRNTKEFLGAESASIAAANCGRREPQKHLLGPLVES